MLLNCRCIIVTHCLDFALLSDNKKGRHVAHNTLHWVELNLTQHNCVQQKCHYSILMSIKK